jgi:hypothetical protein
MLYFRILLVLINPGAAGVCLFTNNISYAVVWMRFGIWVAIIVGIGSAGWW